MCPHFQPLLRLFCYLAVFYQFQIKDDLKAARIEAARRTEVYVEQPKTSQRREGLDLELGYWIGRKAIGGKGGCWC
jgi:hypothetical protein